MYFLIGIKHPFSEDVDIIDQDESYTVLARIQKAANTALTSDDPYVMKYKRFEIQKDILE